MRDWFAGKMRKKDKRKGKCARQKKKMMDLGWPTQTPLPSFPPCLSPAAAKKQNIFLWTDKSKKLSQPAKGFPFLLLPCVQPGGLVFPLFSAWNICLQQQMLGCLGINNEWAYTLKCIDSERSKLLAGLTLDTLLVICRWWSCSSWSKCWTRASVRTSLNWRFYHDRWVYLKIFKWIFGQYRTPGCITQLFQVPVQWDAPIVCCFYWHKHIDRDWLTNWYFCVAHLILCAPDTSQERRPSVV